MAEVTRQEFADMCSVDMDSLRSYISRKKVIVHGKDGKLIDTTHPLNKAFKDLRKSKAANKRDTQSLINSIPVNPNKGKQEQGDDDDDMPASGISDVAIQALMAGNLGGRAGRGGGEEGGMQKWIKMKIKGDGELVAVKVEKERLLLSKAAGELLPVDVALTAHKIYLKSIVNSFEQAALNIAKKFCHIMAGGNMDMYTKITEELRKELHSSINAAGGETNRDLELMIKEFTESKRIKR